MDDDVWVGSNNEQHWVRRWSHGGDGNDDMGQWGDTVVTCHVSGVQGDHISMSRTVSRMSQHFKHKHTVLDLGPQLDR